MDRELIIRLAREAGAVFPADGSWHKFETAESLKRFAILVAHHERERICKQIATLHDTLALQSLPSGVRTKGLRIKE